MVAKQKLGLATVSSKSIDVCDQLVCIKNAGFDAFFTMWLKERTEQIANTAARLGLYQQSIHSPFTECHLLWEEGEAGVSVAESLCDCVRDCARFDIPIMVIHPIIGFDKHTPTSIGISNYSRVVNEAARLGVRLAFENVEGEEYLTALMEHFKDCPEVGFCFDTGHEMCYNGHRDMLALYGDRLIHTHLNDNLGVRGDFITWHDDLHLMPTDGIADWHDITERIRKTGYNGILMSELAYDVRDGKNGTVHRYSDMPFEEFSALAYAKIKSALSI